MACVCVAARAGRDAEARRGRGGVRGVPLLQAAHGARPVRAHLHDRAAQVRLLPGTRTLYLILKETMFLYNK